MAQLVRRAPSSRAFIGAAVIALVGALILVGTSTPDARGAASVTTRRLGGVDRYETARTIGTATFGASNFAILARGENFPDALAGSYVAGGAPGAPVFLTPRDALSPFALNGLQTINAKGVVLLGGVDAISQAVENDLKGRGYAVKRLFGTDRYGTAAEIAKSLPSVGQLDGLNTALVASGEEFPDALTGGPMAYAARFPILLTQRTGLPLASDQALTTLNIKHAIILGGTDRITTAIETRLAAKGISSERLAGATRRGTANAIATFERTRLGFTGSHVNLGRGDLFPDALAGGPHGGVERAPILLTENPNALGAETAAYLQSQNSAIESIDVFGGGAAISDAVVSAAQAAATCAAPTTTTTGVTSTTTSGTTTTVAPTTTIAVTTTAPTPCVAPPSTTSTTAGSTTTTVPGNGGDLCTLFPGAAGCPTPPTTSTTAATTSTVSM